MTVYLGTFGKVELLRSQTGLAVEGVLRAPDVSVAEKRFSFDFEHGALITGDKVMFSNKSRGEAIGFVDSYTLPAITRFVHVDDIGGIRLFDTFAKAVNGLKADAIALANPSQPVNIKATVKNGDRRLLAQVKNYELNTERESVDTTSLSDEFRSRINTLMSGSGRMSCFWEYTGDTANELPNYLVELAIRTKIGGQFHARFYLKTTDYNPSGVAARSNDEVFYDFDALITSCAVQFAPDNTVQVTADFITTGPVQLRMNLDVPQLIVQESGDGILLDQDAAAKLGRPSDT